MPRALRLTLWTLGALVVLLGGAVLWIDSELKPDPLGKRVAAALSFPLQSHSVVGRQTHCAITYQVRAAHNAVAG